jgi:predicted RND superfamily exporter protein
MSLTERFLNWRNRREWMLVAVSLAFCVALACGLGRLRLNANYNAYFDADDAILETHRELSNEFSQYDGVAVVLEFEGNGALAPQAVELLRRVVIALKGLTHVVRVTSVLDIDEQDDTELSSDPELSELFAEGSPTGSDMSFDPERVFSDPRGGGISVAYDQSALVIDVSYALPSNAGAAVLLETLRVLRDTIDTQVASARLPVTVRYSGALALNEAYVQVVRHDLKIFLPSLIVLLFALLGWLLRSARAAAMLLLVATLAVLAGFGGGGW